MPDILLLSTDDQLNSQIRSIVSEFEHFDLTVLKTRTMGVQYLNYELPEINIINWSDPVLQVNTIVEEMMNDPWLHFGACIFIYEKSSDAEKIRRVRGLNLLTYIERDRVGHYLNRVLAILDKNPNLLNQWNFSTLIKSHLQGSLKIERDAFDLLTHANLLVNFLANANLIGVLEKDQLFTFLLEKLMNIVEHSHGRGHGTILLEFHFNEAESLFKISTEDHSFSWDKTSIQNPHDFISVALEGGQRSLIIRVQHQKAQGGLVPNIFDNQTREDFKPGETVFNQGEESSHLYFIVTGEYEVIANGKRISTLGPSDVFLGEMSFLLKNKRTATVKALTHGTLVKISKQQYIQTLKEKPHYAFFLARMLAERLAKIHQTKL